MTKIRLPFVRSQGRIIHRDEENLTRAVLDRANGVNRPGLPGATDQTLQVRVHPNRYRADLPQENTRRTPLPLGSMRYVQSPVAAL